MSIIANGEYVEHKFNISFIFHFMSCIFNARIEMTITRVDNFFTRKGEKW